VPCTNTITGKPAGVVSCAVACAVACAVCAVYADGCHAGGSASYAPAYTGWGTNESLILAAMEGVRKERTSRV
jgi:hypothetical protein